MKMVDVLAVSSLYWMVKCYNCLTWRLAHVVMCRTSNCYIPVLGRVCLFAYLSLSLSHVFLHGCTLRRDNIMGAPKPVNNFTHVPTEHSNVVPAPFHDVFAQACTFHNRDGASSCEMCGTPNPSISAGGAGAAGADDDSSAAYWSCQVPRCGS